MNVVLFEPNEVDRPLLRTDRRAIHVLKVLRRQTGDTFDAGILNGPRGKAKLVAIGENTIDLEFSWEAHPAPLHPITLIVGLPRPQTARDILRDATTLGVTALHFVSTEKSEPSYSSSSLWHTAEWRRQVILGAEQAFDTRIPAVKYGERLADVLPRLATNQSLALDQYESSAALGAYQLRHDNAVVLAIGPERGWTGQDRSLLRRHAFHFAHLGARVLRTETSVTAALAIIRAKLGLM